MLNLSENSVQKELDEIPLYSTRLVNVPKRIEVIRRWITGILIFLFLCLFLPWQQNIQSKGIMTVFEPEDRPQTIQSVIAGRIEKWFVREGDFVHRGDTILMLSEVKDKFFDPQIVERSQLQIEAKGSAIESKRHKVDALENQIEALRMSLKLSVEKAVNKLEQAKLKVITDSNALEAAKVDFAIAKRQYEAQESMYEKGIKSLSELEAKKAKFQQNVAYLNEYQNKLAMARNDLLNARIELSSIKAEYTDKISKAISEKENTLAEIYEGEVELGKYRIDFAGLQVRQGMYAIRAPQDGYVIRASLSGIGEIIKEGDMVFTIMPDKHDMAAELYIKPVDLPLLYEGCKVRVQFDGWPALVFAGWPNISVGTFGGVVRVIDRVSTSGMYRILVTRDPDDDPWPEQLRPGSGVYGWTMLNNVPVWYELWRQFNGFPPNYMKEDHFFDENKADKSDKEKK